MCGIAGIVSAARPVNGAAVAAMTALMAHRGPDGQGLWENADRRVAFGHRRLAIIDPSAASAQPMVAGDLALTYNGEIYNYLELRAELAALGERFATEGDVEVILAAWRAWGRDCVLRFNGMFAFALWDGSRRELFCARDRFGEKPFLYAEGDGFFAFASEYRALLALDGIETDIDESRLARFLMVPADGLDGGGTTLFGGIRQLPAGHRMIMTAGDLRPRIEPYWTGVPAEDAAGLSPQRAAERFRDLLDDSIRLRLRSDVAVGSCLSGGLDSGAIACLVRRRLGPEAPYHTFSGRFPGEAVDEGAYMDALAAEVRPVRHEVAPNPAALIDDLAEFAWANELPVDSASQYAQYCVFRLARANNVLVLLDGQGADEVLGGYEQYFAAYLAGRPAAEAQAVRARYAGALDHMDPWHARLPAKVRWRLAHLLRKGSDLAFGLRPDLAADTRAMPVGSLHDALRRDSLGGFLATLLRYGDRNAMAHSVEVRLPFTDHRLFEFAQGLAPEHLMGDAQTKRLLREAMRGVLPEMVRSRWRKQGFLPPHVAWLKGGLLGAVTAMVEDSSLSPLWCRAWWRGAIRRLQAGDHSVASGLFKVLATEAWRTGFLARAKAGSKLHPVLD